MVSWEEKFVDSYQPCASRDDFFAPTTAMNNEPTTATNPAQQEPSTAVIHIDQDEASAAVPFNIETLVVVDYHRPEEAAEASRSCPICLVPFQKDDLVHFLPCGCLQPFHVKCIRAALRGEMRKCPTCNSIL